LNALYFCGELGPSLSGFAVCDVTNTADCVADDAGTGRDCTCNEGWEGDTCSDVVCDSGSGCDTSVVERRRRAVGVAEGESEYMLIVFD